MQINITYDSSVTSAPAGYKAAINAAVKFFDETFSTPITVNITVGWGEVDGTALPAGSVGGSATTFAYPGVNAGQFSHAVLLGPHLAQPGLDVALGDTTAGFDGQGGYISSDGIPFAEARAIGLASADPSVPDGYIALNPSVAYTFNPNDRAVTGEYDAIGTVESEIAQVLGVVSFGEVYAAGQGPPLYAPEYTPLDLFRYLSLGVHDYSPGDSYFSLNGEQMLLPFNNPSDGGSPAGWASSVTGDALDAFAQPGVELNFSTIDIRLMQVLGYEVSDVAPTPNGTPTKPLVIAKTQGNASGHTLSYDGPYAILLDDNVTYTNHGSIVDSGTCSQIDVVGVTENAGDGAPSNSIFSNAQGATLSVTATALAADAAGYFGYDDINNSGIIQVVSDQADAWGVEANAFTNTITGTVIVQAENNAYGAYLNFLPFTNAGKIEVTGFNAIGVEGDTSFSNSGTIEATGIGQGATSTAIEVWPALGAADNDTNSGLIQGQYAIKIPGGSPGDGFTLSNSGTINGIIQVDIANLTIDNTGTINGAIELTGGGSTYNGVGGTQSGGIFLGYAANTVTLGNDGEAVAGGGDADTITGGNGNDFVEVFGGNNTINGGRGFNTLSFADAAMAVTINLATGTANADGTDAIQNIQEVIGGTYGDTMIAGSSAVTFIAGSGKDTLTGGAGNDTLVAGAGGDTITGGGGNNTFIYSAGDNQLVITDFGTAGDKNVLDIDGYTTTQSIAQQGANTLITLSATDSILLDNVTVSSLTSGEIVYNASPYQAPSVPISVPIFGTTTITFDYNLTIPSGEFINEANQGVGFYENPASSSSTVTLTNYGSINVSQASGNVSGLSSQDINQNSDFVNAAGGTFATTDTDPSGTAYGINFNVFSFSNAGSLSVSAQGDAYGINNGDPNATLVNDATGTFAVTSAAGTAIGFYIYNGDQAGAQHYPGIVNDGIVDVTGAVAAYGIESGNFGSSSGAYAVIANNGTILVSGENSSTETYGIEVAVGSTITNTGTITAGVAIDGIGFVSPWGPTFSVTNSGTINGNIDFTYAASTVTNTGTINGNINFGDGDCSYSGGTGTLNGEIVLGYGKNTVTLGNGNDAVIGGGYEDTITGGSGNDFFEIGRGDNIITGGSGVNTLSLADSDVGVTVNLATGTVTGAGASTISNIQVVIGSSFNDTLIGGSSACTLIAGSGSDKLEGGTGNVTLVAGAGGDVMTGGSGDNTFIYSKGDAHLVITNFDPNGGQDVLDIDGYSKAISTVQKGANTLITLASGANVLLDNVEASSLDSSNLVFNANPWVPPVTPPSPPVYFSSEAPITVDYSQDVGFTSYAGETINIAVTAGTYYAGIEEGRDVSLGKDDFIPVLNNGGTINITSAYDGVMGVYVQVVWADTYVTTNEAGGTLTISDTVGSAYGIANGGYIGPNQDYNNAVVKNAGSISVTAVTDATGVSFGTYNSGTHGALDVTSQTGDAVGLYLPYYVTNNGTIAVTASGSAVGIWDLPDSYGNLGFYGESIVNNGTIIATTSHPGAGAIGIEVGNGGGSSPGTITNTGTITAQTAIIEVGEDGFYAPLIVSNSGTINGVINLGDSDSQLTNSGTINGAVTFLAGPVVSDGLVQAITNSGQIDGNLNLTGSALTVTNTGAIDSTEIRIATGAELISTEGSVVIGTGGSATAGTVAVGTGGTLTGAGTIEANVSVVSGATLQAAGGTLEITGSVGGNGDMTIGNGATLDIAESDTATTLFATGSGILKMGAAASFSGAIGGLQIGDVIDLSGITATSANISAGVLSVVDSNGHDYSFSVSGNLAGNAFAIVSDDQGGTDLVFAAAGDVGRIEAGAHADNGLPPFLFWELQMMEGTKLPDAYTSIYVSASTGDHAHQPLDVFQVLELSLFHSDVLL